MKIEIHERRFWVVRDDGSRRQFAPELGLQTFDGKRKARITRAWRKQAYAI